MEIGNASLRKGVKEALGLLSPVNRREDEREDGRERGERLLNLCQRP